MKFEQFIMMLLLPVGLLLVAGGAAFHHFQYLMGAKEDSALLSEPAKTSVMTYTRVYNDAVYSSRMLFNSADHAVKPAPEKPIRAGDANADNTPNPAPMEVEQWAPIKQPSVSRPAKPTIVGYDHELVIEFDAELATPQNIKRAISRVLLSSDPYAETDLLSLSPLEIRQRPALYRRVLDQNAEPIRYPRSAYLYADYLMQNHRFESEDEEGRFVRIHIPLQPSNLPEPSRRYEAWVMELAQDFNVSPALVFAIMEVESHFNPLAVSRSNAKGLMQIKADAAGKDVYQLIDFRWDAPSDQELFDAYQNIRIGTGYLSLLKHDYFAQIRRADVREMLAISSYNGGMTTVWRLFGRNPTEAIATINRMSPTQVYRKLRYDHHSDETRRYLDKVLQAKAKYQTLLGEDARVLASR
jgi:membrane-bound lytic murein transglycosylase C